VKHSPLKIAVVYSLCGAAWILLSDWLLHLFSSDTAVIARLSTLKGWAFIVVTALVLHRLIAADQAEIRRSGEAVREREELLRNVLDNLPVGVWLLDREGTITYGNRAGERIWDGRLHLGIDRFDEYRGWWLESGMRLAARDWGGARAVLTGREILCEEIEIETFSGVRKIILHSAVPLSDHQGKGAGAIVVCEDITLRKRMEQSLREQERVYRELFENNPQPMWVYEVASMAFLAVNDAAVNHYGYSRQEFLRMTLKDIRPPGDIPTLVASVSGDRGTFANVGVWRHLKKDGTPIFVAISTHDLLFKGLNARLVLVNDITGQRRVEAENAAYQARLRSMAAEMSMVEERERHRLATALHDRIGQVLALAKIRLGGMKDAAGADGCRRLGEEVRSLLDEAIGASRSLTSELSPPALHELGFPAALQTLCENFQKEHGLHLSFSADRSTGQLSDDLRILLFRGVRELLVNIVKHARAESCRVSCRLVDGRIRIEVADDGCGFDPASGGTSAIDGLGFGLFSIRERLHHLGGEMAIHSSPGQGAVVVLTAPLGENIPEESPS
jgi:PAS domain S-box-containing protein